jgi:antitoxin MazE
MHARIQKWGNSLAVRIPRTFARDAHIDNGSTVDIALQDGKRVVSPVAERSYSLAELLKGVTKKNLHGEVDTGRAVGREEV